MKRAVTASDERDRRLWLTGKSFPKKPRKGKPLFDFAQMVGSSTTDARDLPARWRIANISDAEDTEVQDLATCFIDFHKELLEKRSMDGILEPNGSLSNFRALKLAKKYNKRRKVLCTNLSHSSIASNCDDLELIPIILNARPDKGYQVDEQDIEDAVKEHGKDITAVVSTYGTTQLGHAEALAQSESVKRLREQGAWLHIDAAYGGVLTYLSTRISHTLPDADSITVDPYKFVGESGVSLLLVDKDKLEVRKTVPYYAQSPYTSYSTLGAGPLVAWFHTVKDCGLAGLREIADDCVHVARSVALELTKNGVPLILEPRMSIVPVDLKTKENADFVHRKLRENGFVTGRVHINADGYQVYGVRIVITPKVEPTLQLGPASRLVEKLAELYHNLRE